MGFAIIVFEAFMFPNQEIAISGNYDIVMEAKDFIQLTLSTIDKYMMRGLYDQSEWKQRIDEIVAGAEDKFPRLKFMLMNNLGGQS